MLKEFSKKVIKKGAVACLPANLDNLWLDWLVEELSFLKNDGDLPKYNVPPSCAISAVAKILMHRNRSDELKIKDDELYEKLGEYLIEIELERMSRNTEIKYKPATLDTIFTDRQVIMWEDYSN